MAEKTSGSALSALSCAVTVQTCARRLGENRTRKRTTDQTSALVRAPLAIRCCFGDDRRLRLKQPGPRLRSRRGKELCGFSYVLSSVGLLSVVSCHFSNCLDM